MNRAFQRFILGVMLTSSVILVCGSKGVSLSIQGIIGVSIGAVAITYLLMPDDDS